MLIFSIVLSLVFSNFIIGLILVLISSFIALNQKNIEKKQEINIKREKEYEFANLLSYLLVFLENNFNVYQSLQISMGYCKEILANDIEKLLNDIDIDKSILPYQTFAKGFESNIVYQVIMMIYQLDINGYDSKYLNNFPSLITSLKQARIENLINARKMNMSFMTILPIVALILVVFSLVFYIMSSLGGNI